MFTIKNATYVAIMQLGVIVVGVLAAGLCYKALDRYSLSIANSN